MNIIGISGRRSDASSAGAGKDEVAKILAKRYGFCVVSFADEIKRTAMRWYGFSSEQLWGSRKEEPDFRYPREHGPFVKKFVGKKEAEAKGWRGTAHIEVCACCGAEADDWSSLRIFIPKDAPPCFLTPRFTCRFLGTEAGRMLFFDTWVNHTLKIAETLLEDREYDWGYRPEEGLIKWGHNVTDESRFQGVVIPDVRWPATNEGQAIKAAGGRLWLVVRPGTNQTGTASAKHDSETQPVPEEAFDCLIYNDGSLADLERQVILEGGKRL
jgi:hypothetical protein